ncbi:MAG: phosphotransferase [Gammaproteobacteria bacterium]|nr:phosphotransferase [Gammaproteobacteria bacterium]MBT5205324.1 phosphotransferase [Gammaproteobacteria bacterium]MBT5602202.1 phosphotransferase [Gammaproteobacteria bacterium]MBT6246729.1 phosphotransferase [Gammaproteobacteria bacterium]
MIEIPKSIAEVTSNWLGEVLKADIDRIEPTQIGQGIGLMGDIYQVNITYRKAGMASPASVVVKLPSSFEENRQQGIALGMFEAEIRFYDELAPAVSAGLPDIYFTQILPGTADFVIVMEDLSHLTMVNQSDGMSFEQALSAVKVLAGIHAVWWDKVQLPALEWIPSMIGPRIEYVDQLLEQICPVFEAGFGKYLPAGGLELYRQFAGNYLRINTELAGRSPWTVAHQDYRVENMLFGQDAGQVVVIDWQGIGRGPGAYDLAYLLGGSMDIDLRRAHEKELVHAYHAQLTHAGVYGYTIAQAWDDYCFAHLQGGLATSMVTGGTMDLSNERGLALVVTMAQRHITAALDHSGMERLAGIT